MTLALILFAVFIALQIADWWTTRRALKRPGNREGNKLIAALMDKLGVDGALLLVKAVAVACGFGLLRVGGTAATIALAAFCAFYAWVAWRNWRVGRG